jgi:hypothetical protein
MPMKMEDLSAVIVTAIKTAVKPLEQRIRELEQRPGLKYVGVYSEATQYNPGEFATWDGSLWHCNASTRTKPGTSADWTLSVKRGKDARGAAR